VKNDIFHKWTASIWKAKKAGKREAETLLERFRNDASKTRSEVRKELGINGQYCYYYSILFLASGFDFFFFFFFLFPSDFLVSTPPKLTREQYIILLGLNYDQIATILDGKPVITTESRLALALEVRCNAFATSIPGKFSSAAEITSVSLPCSNLTALPESLGLLFPSFFPFFPFPHHPSLV